MNAIAPLNPCRLLVMLVLNEIIDKNFLGQASQHHSILEIAVILSVGLDPFVIATNAKEVLDKIVGLPMQMALIVVPCMMPIPHPELPCLQRMRCKEITLEFNV